MSQNPAPSVLGAAMVLACAMAPTAAQTQRAPEHAPEPHAAAYRGGKANSLYDADAFRALRWREIGPFRAGRSVAVAGSAARPNEYYYGTTGGGVMKTSNGGLSWAAVTDGFFGGSIGAIAVSPSNPDIVYVGTGEACIRNNVSPGDGMYRSTDGGRTWSSIGLRESQQIARVRVHPTNPNIVYAAVFGHVWGSNPERGVYRTVDGGANWERILFRNDSTGAIDIVLDPTNPDVVYAALWQAGRKPWLNSSGGEGSGLFKSTDGGETWNELTRNPGLPDGLIGRIGVTVSPAMPNRVWAQVEAAERGLYRSDDGGATWQLVNDTYNHHRRPWYYSHITADPQDPNTVYILNLAFLRSTDGGRTFDAIRTSHGDHHDLWIAPDDPERMVVADDGGGQVSEDGGRSWSSMAQATGQFYHVSTTNHFPYHVCGAQQDNSTLCGPSRAPGGIDIGDWYPVGGGESGQVVARPDSPQIVYAGGTGGGITRTDTERHQVHEIEVWPDFVFSFDAKDMRYRFPYTFPIYVSPNDPNVLYAAAQILFESRNGGTSWQAISPDLTRNDPATQGPSGGPISREHTGPEHYATINAVAESALTPGLIWAGSDDGLVHVTRDGGRTWNDVTPPDAPHWLWISSIEASAHDPGTAYVAAHNYQMDDFRPYLYRTQDYGRSWTPIVAGIPGDDFTRVVREDPVRRGLLYTGTERGVWVSFDDGACWQPLQQNLPTVPVYDLVVKDDDLVITAHGRGFWIMDDITPLRQLEPGIVESEFHLFAPATASLAAFGGSRADDGSIGGVPRAANPPSGAIVYYRLQAPGRVTLDFLDTDDAVIHSFELETDEPGLHAHAWDLRYPDAAAFRGMNTWSGSTAGATVVPGDYTVRLTVNGRSQRQPLQVEADPRSHATREDQVAKLELLRRIVDRVSAANLAVRTIHDVREQLAARSENLTASQRAELDRATAPLLEHLAAVEDTLYQTRGRNYPVRLNDKLGHLADVVDGTAGRPTSQSYEVFELLQSQLETQLAALEVALRGLEGVNAILVAAGHSPIALGNEDP